MSSNGTGEGAVERQERCFECLRERDVRGVVRGHVSAERPDAACERAWLMQIERKSEEESERLLGARRGDEARAVDAAQKGAHLEIDVTRSVEKCVGLLDETGDDAPVVRP